MVDNAQHFTPHLPHISLHQGLYPAVPVRVGEHSNSTSLSDPSADCLQEEDCIPQLSQVCQGEITGSTY